MEPNYTQRLVIRRLTKADLADVLAYRMCPEMLKYVPEEPMTQEGAASYLAKQADLKHPAYGPAGGWLAFAVYHPGGGKVIGEIGIFMEAEPKSEGNIGWMLHPDYHGQGYATEAARVLLRYAFEERGLHRLTSGCDTRDTASWRLMERLGMRREAHYRQSRRVRGEWQDECLYALLQDEWQATQG